MLKIGKGLHKKKKSKKNKRKEDELFTEEELEQYRKEHLQKTAEEPENSLEKEKYTSEELEKFKALTAGVDDILRKSQGDLDRIKKESFFQRKPTPSELKAQEEREKQELKQTKGNWINFDDKNQLKSENLGQEVKEEAEDSESEYEFDEKNDIFDTTYVEAIQSGEVKLVYVPEDDDITKAGEPDPFDTTSAEEILKKVQDDEEKKKRQISLGLAVQVLTGRAERDKFILQETGNSPIFNQNLVANKAKKRPRKIQDVVLIGSFDEENSLGHLSEPKEETASEPRKSLLDDDLNLECDLPEGDFLITEVLVKQSSFKSNEPVEEKAVLKDISFNNLKEVVSEFDAINEKGTAEVRKAEEIEDQFDEFTALAVSSVTNQKLEEELQKFEDLENDPFDTSSANIILNEQVDPFGNLDSKIPPPEISNTTLSNVKWSAFATEEIQEEAEIDPFDTTFAEKIEPGKCELKLLENEILGDIVESSRKSDTHQEARILSRSNSSSDFNLREEELLKHNCQNFRSKVCIQITDPSGVVETQRNSESEPVEEDLVTLSFKHRDLLGGSTTDLTKLGNDPLPPEIESPLEDFSKYSDPFDTSIVDQVKLPGKAELKFIEKELLSDIPKVKDEDSLSDKDFDPREEESPKQKVFFDIPSPIASDIFACARDQGLRPLTPYCTDIRDSESEICDFDDPFDTSHLTLLPGKEELKTIEKALNCVQISPQVLEPIHKKLGIGEDICADSYSLKHSLSDQDFNPREKLEADTAKADSITANRRFSDITGLSKNQPSNLNFRPVKSDLLVVEEEHSVKALSPEVEEDFLEYNDPFDTSIAENIVPSKAELKVLESELITDSERIEEIKRSYTDPDFNPRDEPAEKQDSSKTDILSLPERSGINVRPLSPVDFDTVSKDEIDPFDTSMATNLLPGKAELRVLESELFGHN